MRSLFLVLALWLCCFCIDAQTTGSVAGRVTCADTRTPCRFASVTIESAPPLKNGIFASPKADSPLHTYAAATDLDGLFAMNNVAPGEYYVTAIVPGYLSPYDLAANESSGDVSLKPKAVEIALERIGVAAGQSTTANILLTRGASLSGTVRYDDGGVAIQVAVSLLRRDGGGKWQPYTNTVGLGNLARLGFDPRTDDHGRFYAPGLPPGTYTLQMRLPETTMLQSGITGKQSFDVKMTMGGALRVFYGDKYRLKEAKAVELHEGEERSGLDIAVSTAGLHTVRGLVTAKTQGLELSAGRVTLLDPEDGEVLRDSFIQPDGTYAFDHVAAGPYMLKVEAKENDHGGRPTVQYETLTMPLLVEGDLINLNAVVIARR